MRYWTVLITLVSMSALTACCQRPAPAGSGGVTEQRWLSDAVPPQDGILGRIAGDGVVRLLTRSHRLISLDLEARRLTTVLLAGIKDDEDLSGLGRLPDGSLWTLSGWTTLVHMTAEGGVIERRELGERHTGLHSGFDRLVYQPLDFTGGAAALVTRADAESEVVPWGTLRVLEGTDPGPLRLAQSLASCGVEVEGRMPCWLSNASAVELMDRDGRPVLVTVGALAGWVSRDASEYGRNPHKVIRDVWLQSRASMWVLVRPAASEVPEQRGVRGLWLVTADGDVKARHELAGPARLLVGAGKGHVFVLTTEGHVVRVEV